MPLRIRHTIRRAIVESLMQAFLRLLGEVSVQPAVRDEIDNDLRAVRTLLDSDGDGIPDAADQTPHGEAIRALASAPVAQGAGVGSHPVASGTAEPVDNAVRE